MSRLAAVAGRWHLVLVLAATLAGAEATVRVLRPTVHAVSATTDDYSAAVWRRHRRGPATPGDTVLVLGNSAAREGIDQDALARSVGRPVDNFGLSAVDLVGLADIPLEPAADGVALLCMNHFLLDHRSTVRYEWQVPAFVPHLVHYRGAYLQIARERLGSWLGRGGSARRAPRQYAYDRPLDAAGLAALAATIERDWSGRPRADEAETVAALRRLLDRLEWAGYRVVVVWMPSREGGPAPTGETAVTERVRRELAALGVPQYDPPPALFDDADWYDFNHLLDSGRDKLTSALAGVVDGDAHVVGARDDDDHQDPERDQRALGRTPSAHDG